MHGRQYSKELGFHQGVLTSKKLPSLHAVLLSELKDAAKVTLNVRVEAIVDGIKISDKTSKHLHAVTATRPCLSTAPIRKWHRRSPNNASIRKCDAVPRMGEVFISPTRCAKNQIMYRDSSVLGSSYIDESRRIETGHYSLPKFTTSTTTQQDVTHADAGATGLLLSLLRLRIRRFQLCPYSGSKRSISVVRATYRALLLHRCCLTALLTHFSCHVWLLLSIGACSFA